MVLNARLARHMGAIQGTFVNFATGSMSAIAAAIVVGLIVSRDAGSASLAGSAGSAAAAGLDPVRAFAGISSPWILTGGVLGVAVVILSNRVIPRLPVFVSTALLFVGQIGAGLGLDFARTGCWNWRNFFGALLVCAGIVVNALAERNPAGPSA